MAGVLWCRGEERPLEIQIVAGERTAGDGKERFSAIVVPGVSRAGCDGELFVGFGLCYFGDGDFVRIGAKNVVLIERPPKCCDTRRLCDADAQCGFARRVERDDVIIKQIDKGFSVLILVEEAASIRREERQFCLIGNAGVTAVSKRVCRKRAIFKNERRAR